MGYEIYLDDERLLKALRGYDLAIESLSSWDYEDQEVRDHVTDSLCRRREEIWLEVVSRGLLLQGGDKS